MKIADCKDGDIVDYEGEMLWISKCTGTLTGCYTSQDDFDNKRNTGFIQNSAEVVLYADGNVYPDDSK